MRPPRYTAALVLCMGVLVACGGESPVITPAGDPSAGHSEGSREVIAPDFEAKIRTRALARRGEPLETGDVVEGIEALPAGEKRVVVFYRGHW